MTPVTIRDLEWIHDCRVLSFTIEPVADDCPNCVIRMKCPRDLGFAAWEGKILQLHILEIHSMNFFGAHHVGHENVDAIRSGITHELLRERADYMSRSGGRTPSIEMTIGFTTGSLLAVLCESIAVVVEEAL